MIKVGIAGGAGYTAGELIRILLQHPEVKIHSILSTSRADELVAHTHQDLLGSCHLVFDGELKTDVDVLFLCLGHGKSKAFLQENTIPEEVKIIDLSQDFRWSDNAEFEGRSFVYGLTESVRQDVENAQNIANPGCFATAIQLALLPFVQQGVIEGEIHVNAMTGSTGAGQSPSSTTHFSWRNNNISVYKAFEHQHLVEVKESLKRTGDKDYVLNFIPMRGNFTRGILATAYFDFFGNFEEIVEQVRAYYTPSPFVHVIDVPAHLKQVVNTNKCLLQIERHGNKILVTSMIDNLLKGASGQAVQNMNLMFGFPEGMGLNFKANAF